MLPGSVDLKPTLTLQEPRADPPHSRNSYPQHTLYDIGHISAVSAHKIGGALYVCAKSALDWQPRLPATHSPAHPGTSPSLRDVRLRALQSPTSLGCPSLCPQVLVHTAGSGSQP